MKFSEMPLYSQHEKRSKEALLKRLCKRIILSLQPFNGWLKHFLTPAIEERISAVQDRDPYLESLLVALHGRK